MLSKRERNRLSQRRRILESAFRLFAAHGFDAVTMAQVAQGAGVSRATVFTYFPAKRALIDAMTGEVVGYWHGLLDRALEEVETPVPILIRALLDHMAANIERFDVFNRGVFREIAKLQAGLDEGAVAQASSEASAARLTKLMARGQERGELSREYAVEDLVVALSSVYNGAIIKWLFEDRSESLRVRMHRAAEILLGPVERQEMSYADSPLPDLAPSDISPLDGSELTRIIQGDRDEDR
jgi:AcrR family transcriptional regulator